MLETLNETTIMEVLQAILDINIFQLNVFSILNFFFFNFKNLEQTNYFKLKKTLFQEMFFLMQSVF